jgi:acetyl-CoA/propionyl-CoA carboxylase biotin carboxyl carrier protein
MFRRVLIANRGEIAVRVIRACRELGIESIAVYSEADANARHVLLADRAVAIGPAAATESYLRVERIMQAARETSAEAVHPGYGFLSENDALATACADAGIVFIGPPPEALRLMGSKIEARRVAERANVPVVPGGVPDDQSDAALLRVADAAGFPVLIKPAAGGGGIGMKVVRARAGLADAAAQARREAAAAFGDPTLYLERLIERPRHIEIQILADGHGNAVHLFERECSLQRRHQKVIEESPSTAVTPRLRKHLGDGSIRIARDAGYQNAGTAEFLVEGAGDDARFYFLEMNARLQVEHPVTEGVTGVDLVHAQLRVASGEALPWTQDALTQRGHAIELRIYAEDPQHDYLPQAGTLLTYREPSMPGIRIDSGVAEGTTIPVHYDPLVAKLIATGETREAARRRALAALGEFPILGVVTNASFLAEILRHPRFVTGDLDTHFLDHERATLIAPLADPPPAIVEAIATRADQAPATAASTTRSVCVDPWDTIGRTSGATGEDAAPSRSGSSPQ